MKTLPGTFRENNQWTNFSFCPSLTSSVVRGVPEHKSSTHGKKKKQKQFLSLWSIWYKSKWTSLYIQHYINLKMRKFSLKSVGKYILIGTLLKILLSYEKEISCHIVLIKQNRETVKLTKSAALCCSIWAWKISFL